MRIPVEYIPPFYARSVSISGEGERKMVKEIVRRARDPVKARVVPVDIVEKYRKKLAILEADVTKVNIQKFYKE